MTWTAGVSDAFATYGTVTIKKVNRGDPADLFAFDASPALGASSFSLNGDGSAKSVFSSSTVHANAGYYDAAPYYVSERPDADYELKDITCATTAAKGAWWTYGKGTPYLDKRKVAIKVGVGEKVECVFTNQRKTGTIVVEKDLVPAGDSGRLDLEVDGGVVRADAGDGDSGAVSVAHQVSESGANLDAYVRRTTCTKADGTVVAQGGGAVSVDVGAYDVVTCVVKNERKAKIVVEKRTVPADTAADKTAFDFTLEPGAPFTLTDGGRTERTVAPGKAYTLTEADARAKGYRLTGIACFSGTTDVAKGTATVTPQAGDVVTCTYTNAKLQPAIHVDKTGPATAYSGDTLQFGFAVTNTGEVPLVDVNVVDDRCAPVLGPDKRDANADDVLDPGEVWHYGCTMVATHALGQPNPVSNTVTAKGTDAVGDHVQDEDRHDTLFLHPAIDIEKTGPAGAVAVAGARVTYTLEVANPGDVPFAKGAVDVTDPRCLAAPALGSVNGDASPGSLDPGDRWTYTCDVQTAPGAASVVNVAGVEGTDQHARVVTDEDTFTTTLTQPEAPVTPETPVTPQAPAPPATPAGPAATAAATPAPAAAPAQQVAGTKATSRPQRGTARLRGPAACPRTSAVTASVTGRQIRRVTFLVDGRRVRTVTKADRNGRWLVRLRTASLRRGANSVIARVQFTTASQTRTRNLRITITRCAPRVVRPRFTG